MFHRDGKIKGIPQPESCDRVATFLWREKACERSWREASMLHLSQGFRYNEVIQEVTQQVWRQKMARYWSENSEIGAILTKIRHQERFPWPKGRGPIEASPPNLHQSSSGL